MEPSTVAEADASWTLLGGCADMVEESVGVLATSCCRGVNRRRGVRGIAGRLRIPSQRWLSNSCTDGIQLSLYKVACVHIQTKLGFDIDHVVTSGLTLYTNILKSDIYSPVL